MNCEFTQLCWEIIDNFFLPWKPEYNVLNLLFSVFPNKNWTKRRKHDEVEEETWNINIFNFFVKPIFYIF